MNIGRGLNVGGGMRVSGDGRVDGDFRVGGWLDAPFVKGILKGLFPSAEKLARAYPFPREGWVALVGDTLPAPVYRCEGRRWVATGETGGGPQLHLDSVIEKIERETSERTAADNSLSSRIDELVPLQERMDNVEIHLDNLEEVTALAVETEEAEVVGGRYFNFRGVNPGDYYRQLQPDTTSEAGFTAATRFFSTDGNRAVVLTARGNDMVRGYVALDSDMKVVAMAGNDDRVFNDTFIRLPRSTRYLLMESYDVPLKATIYGDTLAEAAEEADPFRRRREIDVREGACYDFGEQGEIGDVFNESRIGFVASIPTSRIAIAEWKSTDRLTVTMNTGTPNVWGICYLDKDNVIIGREEPLRKQLKEEELTPPVATRRIVFQTYDPELFPMDIRLEYNILDYIAEMENGSAGSSAGPKPLAEETVLLLGDSISCRRDAAGKTLGDYLGEISGAEVINCSVGGARLSRRRSIEGADFSDPDAAAAAFDVVSVADALASGDITPQTQAAPTLKNVSARYAEVLPALSSASVANAGIAVIFAGTNDFTSGVDHRSASGDSTIGGAVDRIAAVLCGAFPSLRIFFCTPSPRMSDTSDTSTFSDTYSPPTASSSLPQICGEIARAASVWHFPVVDLYNTLGWNRVNYASMCNAGDGTHPMKGLKAIARAIAAGIGG